MSQVSLFNLVNGHCEEKVPSGTHLLVVRFIIINIMDSSKEESHDNSETKLTFSYLSVNFFLFPRVFRNTFHFWICFAMLNQCLHEREREREREREKERERERHSFST